MRKSGTIRAQLFTDKGQLSLFEQVFVLSHCLSKTKKNLTSEALEALFYNNSFSITSHLDLLLSIH